LGLGDVEVAELNDHQSDIVLARVRVRVRVRVRARARVRARVSE
jgi:hypothetical protein